MTTDKTAQVREAWQRWLDQSHTVATPTEVQAVRDLATAAVTIDLGLPVITCATCGDNLAELDHGDTLDVLALTVLAHLPACAPKPTLEDAAETAWEIERDMEVRS